MWELHLKIKFPPFLIQSYLRIDRGTGAQLKVDQQHRITRELVRHVDRRPRPRPAESESAFPQVLTHGHMTGPEEQLRMIPGVPSLLRSPWKYKSPQPLMLKSDKNSTLHPLKGIC